MPSCSPTRADPPGCTAPLGHDPSHATTRPRPLALAALLALAAAACAPIDPDPAPASFSAATVFRTATADPDVVMDTIRLRGEASLITAYVARPNRPGRFPAAIVLHANRITEPYVASTTQMLAKAGFVGLAVDVFHFLPGNESWEAARRVPGDTVGAVMGREFREPRFLRDVQAGIDWLKGQRFVAAGGVGIVGFCGGGWNGLLVAAQSADVGAVVAFYAPVTRSDVQHRAPMEVIRYIRVPVQYHYAKRDPFIPVADAALFVRQLEIQHTPIEHFDYDAEHGFFAWNRQGVFSPGAAELAWSRVVPFLRANTGKPVAPRALAPARGEGQGRGDAGTGAENLLLHGSGAAGAHH